MKSNAGRIARGALIGIFLGVVGGVGLSYGLHFKNFLSGNVMTRYENAEQVFAVDSENDVAQKMSNPNPPECTSLDDAILRFHVKANSNSDEDIALKYAVRDAVLMEIGGELEADKTKEEAVEYLTQNLERIQEIAVKTIDEAGYTYPVKVYISNDYFPIRQYGDMVFPAGEYQALRIDIGAAQGENFWCILYPMTCYTYDSAAVITKEDAEELERCLSEEEYEKLFINREVDRKDVKVKFKFLEWLGI